MQLPKRSDPRRREQQRNRANAAAQQRCASLAASSAQAVSESLQPMQLAAVYTASGSSAAEESWDRVGATNAPSCRRSPWGEGELLGSRAVLAFSTVRSAFGGAQTLPAATCIESTKYGATQLAANAPFYERHRRRERCAPAYAKRASERHARGAQSRRLSTSNQLARKATSRRTCCADIFPSTHVIMRAPK